MKIYMILLALSNFVFFSACASFNNFSIETPTSYEIRADLCSLGQDVCHFAYVVKIGELFGNKVYRLHELMSDLNKAFCTYKIVLGNDFAASKQVQKLQGKKQTIFLLLCKNGNQQIVHKYLGH